MLLKGNDAVSYYRYLGYGNEEEQYLSDLLTASSKSDFPSDVRQHPYMFNQYHLL